MSEDKKWPPLGPGTRIKTYKPNTDMRGEWTDEAWHSRKWGILGTILRHHDSHGLCYDVRHDDGSEAPYDPSEFDTLPKAATEVVITGLAAKFLKRMTINKELSSLIYNIGFVVVYESVRQVEIVVDGDTGRPFTTKNEAHLVANQLTSDLEAIEARVVEVKSVSAYTAWPA